ncbi:MAG TPA: hypothetical protein VNG04_04640 [Candidatus Acidoferrum sp.]|nr:hypothetical protein [Candidatus Acidoferrum sp.]
MKIIVCNEEGTANVKIVNPAEGDAVVSEVEVAEGQEVTLTATTAHEPTDIEVGEVTTSETAEPDAE